MRQAFRIFVKQPAFAAIAVITLALGIGTNTAIFSVVNAVLLRPLPYKYGDRLVWIWSTDSKGPNQNVSYPDFRDWRAQSRSVESLGSWYLYEMTLTGRAEPERVQGAGIVGDLFGVLGDKPMLGTTFRSEEDQPDRFVVLSHGFWQRSFGSDPEIVGRAITLSGQTFTVAGVMPAGFEFPIQLTPVDVWFTFGKSQFSDGPQMKRNGRLMEVMGLLKRNITIQQAQAEFDVIAAALSSQYPETNRNIGIRLVPAVEQVAGDMSRPLLVLFAAVGCVLLIACVNVANLLLTRASDRRKEMAVRAALGASRGRIRFELLAESLVLAVAAGLVGIFLAVWGVDLLLALNPGSLPRVNEIGVDARVFAFTLFVSGITGLVFGMVPAWRASRVDLAMTLHESGRSLSEGKSGRRLRDMLVIGEIALAMVLLTGAGLFINSFWRLSQTYPGFDPRNVLTFRVSWPFEKYNAQQAGEAFRLLQTKLRAIPGVRDASTVMALPVDTGTAVDTIVTNVGDLGVYIDIEGRTLSSSERQLAGGANTIQPGYFRTMGISLLNGRDFNEHDNDKSPDVAIINESLARAYFPNENPVGKHIKLQSQILFGSRAPTREIVGVASDVQPKGRRTKPQPAIYVPLAQDPYNEFYVVVKSDREFASISKDVRAAVLSVDKDQPIYEMQTMDERMGMSMAPQRFSTLLIVVFSMLALLLAVIGLYSLLSYAVANRTQEMGIRIALGAEIRDVLGLVVRHGMTLAIIGMTIGLLGALALSRFIGSLLYDVTVTDPLTFAVVAAFLILVAFLACWIPARRATKVNPIDALRYQ